ncbi:MAG: hypothetical protein IPM55_14260 [Acidobacteria bacterium]|nr:hypothetical protein [Acidobacteriota bacterium]
MKYSRIWGTRTISLHGSDSWSPIKSGNTTIRGGAGLFYDWFGAETIEQALRVNGLQQKDLVILNPGYPDPFSGGMSRTLPPSLIRIDDGLKMPVVYQTSIGLQQQMPKGIRLMTQYSYRRGTHQLRGRNINAPVPGAAARPTDRQYYTGRIVCQSLRPQSDGQSELDADGQVHDRRELRLFEDDR